MKKLTGVFLLTALLATVSLPIYNLVTAPQLNRHAFNIAQLYSLDSVLPYASKLAYHMGISLFAKQAIVGNQGWLFLGDEYANTITNKKTPLSEAVTQELAQSWSNLQSWQVIFKERNIKDFKILIGPDKSTIYPKLTPLWTRASAMTRLDAIMKADQHGLYLNPAPLLKKYQARQPTPVYYQTDTHWNALGGWLAFDFFLQKLSADNHLTYSLTAKLTAVKAREGGDLARFLRIEHQLTDLEPQLTVSPSSVAAIEVFDWPSNNLVSQGANQEIPPAALPSRVLSPQALNNIKVLWLRDSFGTALSPYMAMVFADTLQVHPQRISGSELVSILDRYQPDYVLVTLVERNLPFSIVAP